jgi:hypothetical protein
MPRCRRLRYHDRSLSLSQCQALRVCLWMHMSQTRRFCGASSWEGWRCEDARPGPRQHQQQAAGQQSSLSRVAPRELACRRGHRRLRDALLLLLPRCGRGSPARASAPSHRSQLGPPPPRLSTQTRPPRAPHSHPRRAASLLAPPRSPLRVALYLPRLASRRLDTGAATSASSSLPAPRDTAPPRRGPSCTRRLEHRLARTVRPAAARGSRGPACAAHRIPLPAHRPAPGW